VNTPTPFAPSPSARLWKREQNRCSLDPGAADDAIYLTLRGQRQHLTIDYGCERIPRARGLTARFRNTSPIEGDCTGEQLHGVFFVFPFGFIPEYLWMPAH
jgi:hypothetical protein